MKRNKYGIVEWDDQIAQVYRALASEDPSEFQKLMKADAVEAPIRQAVLKCDIAQRVFTPMKMEGQCLEFELDLIEPGSEDEFKAFSVPDCGSIPTQFYQSDYVTVPHYNIANGASWCIDHEENINFPMFDRIMEIFRSGFTMKINDDAWHLLLASGLQRNLIPFDNASSRDAGQMTKRLVSIIQLLFRRNGGGNSGCMDRRSVTDLYVSPEIDASIVNWDGSQVDDITRSRIFNENGLSEIFGVRLNTLDELGVGQDYQTYYTSTLGGTMPAGTQEIMVGLDLNPARNSMIMPIKRQLRVFRDDCISEFRRKIVGKMTLAMAILDSRDVMIAAA
jgi:hypothetical protein